MNTNNLTGNDKLDQQLLSRAPGGFNSISTRGCSVLVFQSTFGDISLLKDCNNLNLAGSELSLFNVSK